MKNLFKLLLVAILAISLAGCKEDTVEPTQSEFDVLSTYMKANNLDLGTIVGGFTKGGSGIGINNTDYSASTYYIMDIRSKTDYDKGHAKDAVNVALANVLDEAPKAAGKPILVICYSGQNAARAVTGLRLMGYTAYSLKWGMASWHADFAATWNGKTATVTNANWLTTGTPPALQTYTLPKITTGLTDGKAILETRVKAMLANSSWMVQRDAALAAPGDYFVLNYWPQVSWDAFGHINGAYRIMEDLKIDNLKNIDPSKPCLVYCYTGQTSGIVSAWLEVLGYNAKGLAFGANAIVYDQMKVSDVDGAKTKAWKGAGAGSENNFGYYDAANGLHGPN